MVIPVAPRFEMPAKRGLHMDALVFPFVSVVPTNDENLFFHATPFGLNFRL
jgi:hypothetical protein